MITVDKESGHPKAKVLYNFGREEYVDKEALRRLIKSINRFLGPEEALKAQTENVGEQLRFVSGRPMGGTWFLDQLWQKLGIKDILEKLLKERKFSSPVERAIFVMVANRALNPSSKLAVEQWGKEEVHIEGFTHNKNKKHGYLLTMLLRT
ncbi:hypothetical protein [Calderihabitans maritimus]|uniref:IS4-like transposase n=1 Tax=Calderihabitans maritimus TaxID=1246530 RepID=A0A1Z5HX69_9FIRM|nr:hypothetical protein [Calderihabitans maritimus]GAW93957.1 IS4-like transposase [Calderihabitans maritimus]